jgi:hypothetical protein
MGATTRLNAPQLVRKPSDEFNSGPPRKVQETPFSAPGGRHHRIRARASLRCPSTVRRDHRPDATVDLTAEDVASTGWCGEWGSPGRVGRPVDVWRVQHEVGADSLEVIRLVQSGLCHPPHVSLNVLFLSGTSGTSEVGPGASPGAAWMRRSRRRASPSGSWSASDAFGFQHLAAASTDLVANGRSCSEIVSTWSSAASKPRSWTRPARSSGRGGS